MGLFDAKYCAVCGEKIGLFGNRKLKDGNLCKNCAAKLSPFFDERRESTVEQIKQQLTYHENNKAKVASFHASKQIGKNRLVLIDSAQNAFIVTRGTNWVNENPDVIPLGTVKSVTTDIKEHREEEFKDVNGERVSYDPPKFEYEYEFNAVILVDTPYFDDIRFELSYNDRPEDKGDKYRMYWDMAEDLKASLMSGYAKQPCPVSVTEPETVVLTPTNNTEGEEWLCECGHRNRDLFCSKCGRKKPSASKWFCPKCGRENDGDFCVKDGTPRPKDI